MEAFTRTKRAMGTAAAHGHLGIVKRTWKTNLCASHLHNYYDLHAHVRSGISGSEIVLASDDLARHDMIKWLHRHDPEV